MPLLQVDRTFPGRNPRRDRPSRALPPVPHPDTRQTSRYPGMISGRAQFPHPRDAIAAKPSRRNRSGTRRVYKPDYPRYVARPLKTMPMPSAVTSTALASGRARLQRRPWLRRVQPARQQRPRLAAAHGVGNLRACPRRRLRMVAFVPRTRRGFLSVEATAIPDMMKPVAGDSNSQGYPYPRNRPQLASAIPAAAERACHPAGSGSVPVGPRRPRKYSPPRDLSVMGGRGHSNHTERV
jgi:hypothetical protein